MTDERTSPNDTLEDLDSQELGGRPTTGGSEPGGAPTGLRRPSGLPSRTAGGMAGAPSGGASPTGAGGGTGTSSGGLASGPSGIGGTRNLPHDAGRPGGSVMPGDSGQPELEVSDSGLTLNERPVPPSDVSLDDSGRGTQDGEPSPTR
jgi:hypothetical protein